jgi:phosphoribosylamine---glycine ligase
VEAAPGNPGIAAIGRCHAVPAGDVGGLLALARERRPDLVVVGPEQPLVLGLADQLRAAGIQVLGPTAEAARLEGSKAFAKRFMLEHGIPTAEAEIFSEPDAAAAHVRRVGPPVVVKADGLAAGKGVVVAPTVREALQAIDRFMRERTLGAAGERVLIERYMEGEEATVIALADGERWLLLPTAQDHKRLGDGDQGPNTGGMGACAPAAVIDAALMERIVTSILAPTLAGLRARGTPYRGFLYLGLMIENGAPRVVEYNVRLGDPEAQAVLPLSGAGLVPAMVGAAAGALPEGGAVALAPGAGDMRCAACVVLAAPGYPGTPAMGAPIRGLPDPLPPDVLIFHAGTARQGNALVTAGGRVLGVTGLGRDLPGAVARAYHVADQIEFDGKQMRRDIGQRLLARHSASS